MYMCSIHIQCSYSGLMKMVTMEFCSSGTLRLVVGDLEHSNDASCKVEYNEPCTETIRMCVNPLPNVSKAQQCSQGMNNNYAIMKGAYHRVLVSGRESIQGSVPPAWGQTGSHRCRLDHPD